MSNETSKTKFFSQFKLYGVRKFLISTDFIISFLFLTCLLIDKYFGLKIISNNNLNLIITILAASSSLFAITLASLAILLSFSTSEFMRFLRRYKKLSPLLFLFWLGNSTYLLVIVLSFLYLIINSEKYQYIQEYFYIAIITIFLYALINTFYLLATIIRFGYFIDIYERLKKNR